MNNTFSIYNPVFRMIVFVNILVYFKYIMSKICCRKKDSKNTIPSEIPSGNFTYIAETRLNLKLHETNRTATITSSASGSDPKSAKTAVKNTVITNIENFINNNPDIIVTSFKTKYNCKRCVKNSQILTYENLYYTLTTNPHSNDPSIINFYLFINLENDNTVNILAISGSYNNISNLSNINYSISESTFVAYFVENLFKFSVWSTPGGSLSGSVLVTGNPINSNTININLPNTLTFDVSKQHHNSKIIPFLANTIKIVLVPSSSTISDSATINGSATITFINRV